MRRIRVIAMNTQDFRFPSFPRRRESSQPLKSLDTRFRGYDEFMGLAKVLMAQRDPHALTIWRASPRIASR